MNLHHFFTFRDGKIAYYRGIEDTAQTEAVLRARPAGRPSGSAADASSFR